MSAREAILGRLRAPQVEAPLPNVQAWYAAHRRVEDASQRVSRLRQMLEAVHTEVHDTTDAGWPALLLRIAAVKG